MKVGEKTQIQSRFSSALSGNEYEDGKLSSSGFTFCIVTLQGESLYSVPAGNGVWMVSSSQIGQYKLRLQVGDRALAAVALSFIGEASSSSEKVVFSLERQDDPNKAKQNVKFPIVQSESTPSSSSSSEPSISGSLPTVTPSPPPHSMIFSIFDSGVNEKCDFYCLAADPSGKTKLKLSPNNFCVTSPSGVSLNVTEEVSPFPSGGMKNKQKILSDFFSFTPTESGKHTILVNIQDQKIHEMECDVHPVTPLFHHVFCGKQVIGDGVAKSFVSLSVRIGRTESQTPASILIDSAIHLDPSNLQIGILSDAGLVSMEKRYYFAYNLSLSLSLLFPLLPFSLTPSFSPSFPHTLFLHPS